MKKGSRKKLVRSKWNFTRLGVWLYRHRAADDAHNVGRGLLGFAGCEMRPLRLFVVRFSDQRKPSTAALLWHQIIPLFGTGFRVGQQESRLTSTS